MKIQADNVSGRSTIEQNVNESKQKQEIEYGKNEYEAVQNRHQQLLGMNQGAGHRSQSTRAAVANEVMNIVKVHSFAERSGGLDKKVFHRLLSLTALDGQVSDVEAQQLQNFLQNIHRPEDLRYTAELVEQLCSQSDMIVEKKARGRLVHFYLRRGIQLERLIKESNKQAQKVSRKELIDFVSQLSENKHLSTRELRQLIQLSKHAESLDDSFWLWRELRLNLESENWTISEGNRERLYNHFKQLHAGRLDKSAFVEKLKQHTNDNTLAGSDVDQIFADLGDVFHTQDLVWASNFIKSYLQSHKVRMLDDSVEQACEEYFDERLAGYIDREGITKGLEKLFEQGKIDKEELRALKIALAVSQQVDDFVYSAFYIISLSRPEYMESLERMQDAIQEFFRICGQLSNNMKIVYADGQVWDLRDELDAKWHIKTQEMALTARENALADRQAKKKMMDQ